MIDQESLERAAERFQPPERSYERLVLRRARKERNRRITIVVLAAIITLASLAGLVRAFRGNERTVGREPRDIFAPVHGWIAYGAQDGIWAADPARPEDPDARIRLSDRPGEPVGWSRDGSTLLLLRVWSPEGTLVPLSSYQPGFRFALAVLRTDGTETRVASFGPDSNPFTWGSSLSADGSQVVYAKQERDSDINSVYVVDAEGGRPRLIRNTLMEPFVIAELGWRGMLMWPAWSPDGTQIAYFHGGGDHTENLEVMNTDGSNAHGLFGDMRLDWHVQGLVWSPDGSELAFAGDHPRGTWGIWVIGADGSGYRRVILHGEVPTWSPDGSRIAFVRGRGLYTVNTDGTDVLRIGEVHRFCMIAWNPVG